MFYIQKIQTGNPDKNGGPTLQQTFWYSPEKNNCPGVVAKAD